MIEVRNFSTPSDLAVHLSKYVTDPSALVAGTANHFGRDRAISIDQATRLVMQRRKERERAKRLAEHNCKDSASNDHLPFKPAAIGMVRRVVPKPDAVTQVAPVHNGRKPATLWPAWYRPRDVKIFPRDLVRAVAHDAGLSLAELTGNARSGFIVAVRSVASRILRERGLSFAQIGGILGRDHTSVINCVRKFEHYCNRYPVREIYERHRDAAG